MHATDIMSAEEACRRVEVDHRILLDELDRHPADTLTEPFRVASGPLGDACESLHDLVAHVLMWDEISLAVLHEAAAGRAHWSLDPQWEDPDIGRRLNEAGVAAGRRLPTQLLVHRLNSVSDALSAELGSFSADQWSAPLGLELSAAATVGELAQYAMTVPTKSPYWHAAIHLQAFESMRQSEARIAATSVGRAS
ncbi:MAG TPA: maleylpyruvate isomerase N-terminal domain-containing protein [Jiangellaceae bacterium]